jgi:amino-acid N-acetyltransferase
MPMPMPDELPVLLTEGEPRGESVFEHSALNDRTHAAAHRAGDGNISTAPAAAAAAAATRAAQTNANVRVHKARLQDAVKIYDLVNSLSSDGTLLRRNYAEICENIRDFTVAEALDEAAPGAEPEFLGCGALHLYGPHLAEVRSIVLHPHARGQGAGAALLRALLAESEEHGVVSTCLFTRLPEFFERFGFRTAERADMPDKIYKDCQTCPRLYACDEVAMVKGPLPKIAVLGPTHVKQPDLVQVQVPPTRAATRL